MIFTTFLLSSRSIGVRERAVNIQINQLYKPTLAEINYNKIILGRSLCLFSEVANYLGSFDELIKMMDV